MTAAAADSRLDVVASLVAKARSSPYQVEREALALRAYTLLASFLNAIEPDETASSRRRERRLLNDRRGGGGGGAPTIDLRTPVARTAYEPVSAPAPARAVDLTL